MEEDEKAKAELIEQPKSVEEMSTAERLDKAEEYIKIDFLYAAQNLLNLIDEGSGRKFYLQSIIYKKKRWYNEQRKQLKKAVKAEPDNELYKKELDELMEFRKTAEYKTTIEHPKKIQMGDTEEICLNGCCDGSWGISCK